MLGGNNISSKKKVRCQVIKILLDNTKLNKKGKKILEAGKIKIKQTR